MVDIYTNDQDLIETMGNRIAEKCNTLNICISKIIENDNRLTYELVDLLTGRNMLLNIDKRQISGTTELRKAEIINGWITKSIKLLVNKRYGGEENK